MDDSTRMQTYEIHYTLQPENTLFSMDIPETDGSPYDN